MSANTPRPAAASASSLSLAARLRNASPATYRVLAPPLQAARRAARLARQRAEARAFVRSFDPATLSHVESPRVVLDGAAFHEPNGGIARLWDAVMREWSRSGFAKHVVVVDRAGTAPRLDGFTYLDGPAWRAPDSESQRRMLQAVCDAASARTFVSTLYTRASLTPSVLYVYDMTPEVLGWDLRDHRWVEKADAIGNASALACLTRSTLDDVRTYAPSAVDTPAEVVLPGISPEFTPSPVETIQRLRDELGLTRPYLMFIGHRDGYKNARLLFEAIDAMGASDVGLLLVGGAPELEPEFAELAGDTPIVIARLSDEQLRAAYSGALALVYVSKYEGFGLPIVEAMACGCPVISTRNSSLPEAGGTAAVYIEDDPRKLADAIRQVREPDVRERAEAEGRAWAGRFTWERCAAGLQELIERVAEGTGR